MTEKSAYRHIHKLIDDAMTEARLRPMAERLVDGGALTKPAGHLKQPARLVAWWHRLRAGWRR